MSASQSVLTQYNCDVVMALSQVGMNENLKPALAGAKAPDRYFGAFTDSSSYGPYSLDELKAKTNGIDPLAIPNGANSNTDERLQQLVDVGLLFVIYTRIGSYTLPFNEIDIVSFTGHSSSVTYNLLHAKFEIGEIVPPANPGEGYQWRRIEQTREQPWFFAVKAGVVIQPVQDSTKWTPAVRKEVAKYTSATVFLVSFQLSDVEVLSYPAIPGLQPGSQLHEALRLAVLPQDGKDNIDARANTIGYWIRPTPPSLSVVTAIDSIVSPYLQKWNGSWNGPPPAPVANPTVEQANAATLDLLCAVNNDTLPAPQPFRWNWLKARPVQSHHGVIAVNAATFVAYMRQQLDEHAFSSCWSPVIRADRAEIEINQGGNPTVRTLSGGPAALQYNFGAAASDSAYGVTINMSTSYSMGVYFQNYQIWPTPKSATTIMISQIALIDIDVIKGNENLQAYIVDYALYQEFPLGIDASGQLAVQMPLPLDQISNSSQTLELVQFDLSLQWLQGAVDNITSAAQKYAMPTSVTPKIVTNFFFPFGNAFSFADVSFSDGLDLFGHIDFVAGATR